MQPPAALSRHKAAVEDHLRSLLDRDQPAELDRMLRYHLGWADAEGRPADHTGKRLRPALCLLACEAAGGDPERAVPAAAAVELVHNFSLVHDDVQDRDATRHGRDTVWAIWGEAQAINAGDALLALAHVALAGMAERGVSGGDVVAAARLLNERTLEMVGGQVMDISFEERLDIGLDDYVAMISRKTGALFDASLSLGAIAADASESAVQALGRCGRQLGIAFQVRDDMLGIWGAENRTGKPVAADVRRRKKSLPIVYALGAADGEMREQLSAVYGSTEPSEADVSLVLRALDSAGAQGYCQGVADEHRAAAIAALDGAKLSADATGEIRQVADFLLERDF
ncbi:MAG: polyprenyl synthetase family protein [Dehalococcoidia bacterium]